MLDSFVATIPSVIGISEGSPDNSNFKQFRFTKNRLWFTKEHRQEIYYLHFFEGCPIKNGMKYTVDKAYDENDILRWEIRFPEEKSCRCYVELTWLNAFRCNFMHNRYWLLNEKKWFVTFLVSLIAIVVSILALIKSNGNI